MRPKERSDWEGTGRYSSDLLRAGLGLLDFFEGFDGEEVEAEGEVLLEEAQEG